MKENEFMECTKCSYQPGSPTLCKSCLHNRNLIFDLKNEIHRLKMELKHEFSNDSTEKNKNFFICGSCHAELRGDYQLIVTGQGFAIKCKNCGYYFYVTIDKNGRYVNEY